MGIIVQMLRVRVNADLHSLEAKFSFFFFATQLPFVQLIFFIFYFSFFMSLCRISGDAQGSAPHYDPSYYMIN